MHARAGSDAKERMHRLTGIQFGLVTRKQLEDEVGLSRSAIDHLLSRGDLIRVQPGVYRAAAARPTFEQDALAACFKARDCYASHRTAARLHGIACPTTDHIELVTTGNARSNQRVVVHRTKALLACDRATVSGIPCTDVNRTLLDLGSVVPPRAVEDALDSALVFRLTSLSRVEWRLTRHPMKGHPGAAALRTALRRHGADGSSSESLLETKLLRLLNRAGLPAPVPQFPIAGLAQRRFRADFAYPGAKLLIEVHGYRWHGGFESWRRDLQRSSDLATQGWRLIYVTADDLKHRPEETVDRIRRALMPQLWREDMP